MKLASNLVTMVLLVLLMAAQAIAETRYISDYLVVTVRDNKTGDYNVLTTLPTATPVEVLEEDKDFVKVHTQKGIEGYIQKQYVTKQTPKAILVARLSEENAALKEKLEQQARQFQDASGLATSSQTQIAELTQDLEQAHQQLEKVRSDYQELRQNSEDLLDITTARDQLLEENNRLVTELQVLQEENRSFHRSNMIQWFLAGGGVFFFGWLIGKVSRKKRGFSRL